MSDRGAAPNSAYHDAQHCILKVFASSRAHGVPHYRKRATALSCKRSASAKPLTFTLLWSKMIENKEVVMKSKQTMMFLLMLWIYGCESPTDSGNISTPLFSQVISNGAVYSLSIPATQFDLSDTLRGVFRVTNGSERQLVYNFANVQQLGFQLLHSNGTVAMYYPIAVSPALSSLTLQPGDTKEYSILSLFKDENGNYISSGPYQLSVYLLDHNSPQVSLQIRVN